MLSNRSGEALSKGKLIAKGGEGSVFETSLSPQLCLKIYTKNLRTKKREHKLLYMCENAPKQLEGDNFKICWPQDIIYEDGEFVGFVMPRAFRDSIILYHLCLPNMSKAVPQSWHKIYNRDSTPGIIARLKLSTNIVAAINVLSELGSYHLVDLKPQNILVSQGGKVSLIDLDSIQISNNGNVLYAAPVSTPEYTPPEANELLRKKLPITTDWDVFSIGVLVYEVLCGIHPYAGTLKPPFDNLTTIAEKIQKNQSPLTVGNQGYSVVPPPHEHFNILSNKIKSVFKEIFQKYELNISKRPKLDVLGINLYNEVTYIEQQRVKLEFEKAKKQLEAQLIKYKDELDDLNDEYDELKKRSEEDINNKRKATAFLGILLGLAVIIIMFMIDKYNHDREELRSLKTTNNGLEEERDCFKQTSEEYKLKNDIIYKELYKLRSENSSLKARLERRNRDLTNDSQYSSHLNSMAGDVNNTSLNSYLNESQYPESCMKVIRVTNRTYNKKKIIIDRVKHNGKWTNYSPPLQTWIEPETHAVIINNGRVVKCTAYSYVIETYSSVALRYIPYGSRETRIRIQCQSNELIIQ